MPPGRPDDDRTTGVVDPTWHRRTMWAVLPLCVAAVGALGVSGCASKRPTGERAPQRHEKVREDVSEPKSDDRIRVYEENPAYWQYKGKPVVLLGGSVEDNLYQIPDLEEHLDLLRSVGGNYVRCTMSSRDKGNVWPFAKVGDAYDLNEGNEEFWRRFETFLELTAARDIIVQIEVWATFDFYRDNWERNPFNPENNVNYTAEESRLPAEVDSHPVKTGNPFFWSVPPEHNNTTVLGYQQAFVDRLLSHTLGRGHVLYCMDNETSVTPEWGAYWSEYIKAKAKEAGVHVETTEMWDPHDLAHPMHTATFDHPETYSFVDISQNNHQRGQAHWDNARKQRERVHRSGEVRPLTNVKIYGADTGRFGGTRDGIERFWRNIFGGMASARFHRPGSGLGLGELAQANVRSMRSLLDRMDPFTCEPRNDLLAERAANGAYCFAQPGREYAVYFPDGGKVSLDVSAVKGSVRLEWLDVLESTWRPPEEARGGGRLELVCPGGGYWAACVRTAD